jgi:hypothetical protein
LCRPLDGRLKAFCSCDLCRGAKHPAEHVTRAAVTGLTACSRLSHTESCSASCRRLTHPPP